MTPKGRKPTTVETPALPAIPEDAANAMIAAAEETGAGITMVLGYEETLKQLGALEALEFVKRVSEKSIAEIFTNIKKTKTYIGLPYKDDAGNMKRVSSLDEFCEVKLGKTYRRCQQLAENLHVLGPEVYEQSERLGLRNKDYRAISALPADEQEAVRQAIKETTSREEIIDLIQEMAVRHVSEKESFAQQVKSKDDLLLSKQKMIEYQANQIDSLSEKARFVAVASPSEKLNGIRTELLAHAADIESALTGKLAPSFAALKTHLSEHGGECDGYLSSALGQIERAVREIRETFGLLRADDVAQWAASE